MKRPFAAGAAILLTLLLSTAIGVEWVDIWDTVERGGLPVAIEIAIAILSPDRAADQDFALTSLTQLAAENDLMIYRLIVHLPAAYPTSESEGEVVE